MLPALLTRHWACHGRTWNLRLVSSTCSATAFPRMDSLFAAALLHRYVDF